MSLLEKIINDCLFLREMIDEPDNHEEFENISLIELNNKFNSVEDPKLTNIIQRVSIIYRGVYPETSFKNEGLYIRLINDFHYLGSPKIRELLILLHYSNELSVGKILSPLKDDIKKEYQSIIFENNFKNTIISLSLTDLLKSKKNVFENFDLEISLKSNVETFKYIYENIVDKDDINISELFSSACEKGNFEIAQYLFENASVDIHYKEDDPFTDACSSGNLKLVQWLLSLQKEYGEIDIHVYNDYAFKQACYSGNLELVKWLWNYGLQLERRGGRRIDHLSINENDGIAAFTETFTKGNTKLIQFIWDLGGINIHDDNEHIFRLACSMGNLNIVKYVYNLSLLPGIGAINIHSIDQDGHGIFKSAFRKIEIVKWLYNLSCEIDPITNTIRKFDVYANDYEFFIAACYYSNVDVAQFIWNIGLETGPGIDLNKLVVENNMFKNLCSFKELQMIQWMFDMCNIMGISIPLDQLNDSRYSVDVKNLIAANLTSS